MVWIQKLVLLGLYDDLKAVITSSNIPDSIYVKSMNIVLKNESWCFTVAQSTVLITEVKSYLLDTVSLVLITLFLVKSVTIMRILSMNCFALTELQSKLSTINLLILICGLQSHYIKHIVDPTLHNLKTLWGMWYRGPIYTEYSVISSHGLHPKLLVCTLCLKHVWYVNMLIAYTPC